MAGAYRNLFGGLILIAIALINKERLWRGWKPICWAILCGLIFAFDLTLWHKSVHYIGPGLSTLLGNLQVIILTGFGIAVLKEKLTIRFIVSVPIALIGMVLIFIWQWDQLDIVYKTGIILGLTTAFSYAGFTLTLRRSQTIENALSPVVNLVFVSFAAAVFMAIIGYTQDESFIIPDKQSWLSLIAYGILCQAAAWFLISKSLPKVAVSLAGLILLLQPILAFAWDILFFDRPTRAVEIIGAVMALIAIYLGITSRQEKQHD